MSVRLRYAPSPTGDLHLGSLRTIIFDWLVARQNGGAFVLRIEDTDQARSVEGAVERQLQAMSWMGVSPDEGVMLDEAGQVVEKGGFGPYTQSKRLGIYASHAQRLLDEGHAYRCFCTPDRLAEMRAEQEKNHQPPRYDQRCRHLSREESDSRAAAGEPFVLRHAIPSGVEVRFADLVRGEVVFRSEELDDYVLMKSDGFPTYHLASVIDDHLMEISHVLRGEEWLPSLPKHVLLYRAFGWQPPQIGHLPVILGPDGKHKLSKRDGDVAINDYQAKGYLPDALFNMLAMIGWSPGTEEEFFTREELVRAFRLDKVQKAPAAFSFDRLEYVNGWYIRRLPVGEVAERMRPYLEAAGLPVGEHSGEYLLSVAAVLQERLKRFDESADVSWFFFRRPTADAALRELVVPKKATWEGTRELLKEALAALTALEPWTQEVLEERLRRLIDEKGVKAAELLWPVRAALTGVAASPGAFEMLAVLGRQEALDRLTAVTLLD